MFNNKSNNINTPVVSAPTPSHKKKNTYVIKLSSLVDYSVFGMCKNTPLAVIEKNGQSVQNAPSGWLQCTQFPNPCALYLTTEYNLLKTTMGKKAATVIEYLDKDTGAPVLMLFPQTIHVFDGYENDYKSHLNHASRRDLEYQMALRSQLIDKAIKSVPCR